MRRAGFTAYQIEGRPVTEQEWRAWWEAQGCDPDDLPRVFTASQRPAPGPDCPCHLCRAVYD